MTQAVRPSTIKLYNALLFDGESEDLTENGSVFIEADTIREVAPMDIKTPADLAIDCKRGFLMPGLIDLHFHVYSVTFDLRKLDQMPPAILTLHAAKHLEASLLRGFTSVRDPGGAEYSLHLAIEQGLINGPRLFFGGKALSQTGGHGDTRLPYEDSICGCASSSILCTRVDGVDAVRKVAREELRKGAHHVKVHVSGGVGSKSDPLWMNQFTDAELVAVVEEAGSRRKYVAAHCHTDEGARRCVRAGVRSIEHGTHIEPETAALIAASGNTYVVPTFAVIHQILEHGSDTGLSQESVAKSAGLLEQMSRSLGTCRHAGVGIGLGTDIFGTQYHPLQSREFSYRSGLERSIDTLRSATSVNAEIMQQSHQLGRIAPGYKADVILVSGNPLLDISIFERHETHMPLIVKNGTIVKNAMCA